jgi:hypothetical protein
VAVLFGAERVLYAVEEVEESAEVVSAVTAVQESGWSGRK